MSRTGFDFSKIIGTSATTSAPSRITRTPSRFNHSRFKPYIPPSDENIQAGIKNLENLIKTFYTNAYKSINDEIVQLEYELRELYDGLSVEEKDTIDTLKRRLSVPNDKERILRRIIIKADEADEVPNLKYKKALMLIVIIYILKDLGMNPDIIDRLRLMKRADKDKVVYLQKLNKFFYNPQPYFRMLNIRGFYSSLMDDDKHLTEYSKFLFEYASNLNNPHSNALDNLNKYLDKIEGKTKIDPNYYKQYYASPEHSGGRRSKKSKAPLKASLKAIKELCKANQIKLSRIIDGKRVVYKKSELIKKLKIKKIKIP